MLDLADMVNLSLRSMNAEFDMSCVRDMLGYRICNNYHKGQVPCVHNLRKVRAVPDRQRVQSPRHITSLNAYIKELLDIVRIIMCPIPHIRVK